MQSRKKSISEAITNTVAGLIISFVIQLIIYPLLDIEVSVDKNIIITIVFLVSSTIRSYVVRRLFNSL